MNTIYITPSLLTKLQTLQEQAAPYTVQFASNPNTSPKPIFTLSLPGEMYVEGTYPEIGKVLKNGIVNDLYETIEWAAEQGLTLVPAKWRGAERAHEFTDADGNIVNRTPAGTAEILAQKRGAVRMGQLRRAGLRQGYQLVSTEWKGEGAHYSFKLPDGTTREFPFKDFFPHSQIIHARRTVRPAAPVRPAQKRAPTAKVAPETPEFTPAAVTPTKHAVAVKPVAPAVETGAHEYLAGLFAERSRTSINFVFHLPDGTKVEAPWQKMLRSVEKILDRKALDMEADCETIETADCIELRKLVAAH
ncbi:hypothetical protein AB4Y45_35115 [Paraburkholderia sp. EG287A]|uniref:hypothetical protein n=1 Tax=Paraburkholderia sp. EG287A TaxID=3237012 RepID=UPI0034D2ECC8